MNSSSGFGLNFVFGVCSVSVCVWLWFVLTDDTETFQTLLAESLGIKP